MARTKSSLPKPLFPLPPNTQPILRPPPDAVAYHIPITPSSPSNAILKTTISLPKYSKWTSGLHFHTRHTEYLHLVRGAIWVYLDGYDMLISAKVGGEVDVLTGQRKENGFGMMVEVPRYARHEWRRAEVYFGPRTAEKKYIKPAGVDEEVVVEEWTDPSDLGKPLFFWNLNGVITNPRPIEGLPVLQSMVMSVLGGWWIPFQLFVIFWDLDNWPVFFGLRGVIGSRIGLEGLLYRYCEGPVEYVMTVAVLFAAKILGWLVGFRAVEQRRTPDEIWKAYMRNDI